MEIEIEARESGDDELIAMMKTQIEIMKSMLIDEMDAAENSTNSVSQDEYHQPFHFLLIINDTVLLF